jgi:GNAT superfamily N-acetyltransferase
MAWVAAQMRDIAPQLDVSVELVLDAAHAGLLGRLSEVDLEPRMTVLHGAPRRALDGLRAGGLDASSLGDLRIEALRSEAQVEHATALLRSLFRAHPRLGYLPPLVPLTEDLQQRIDDSTRQNLRGASEAGNAFVVLRGEEVLGQGAMRSRDDALLGHVGGVAIALAEEIQGRGVGKLLYERLLERMVELEVAVMRGLTVNPRVMRLAARMGRTVRGYRLERAESA